MKSRLFKPLFSVFSEVEKLIDASVRVLKDTLCEVCSLEGSGSRDSVFGSFKVKNGVFDTASSCESGFYSAALYCQNSPTIQRGFDSSVFRFYRLYCRYYLSVYTDRKKLFGENQVVREAERSKISESLYCRKIRHPCVVNDEQPLSLSNNVLGIPLNQNRKKSSGVSATRRREAVDTITHSTRVPCVALFFTFFSLTEFTCVRACVHKGQNKCYTGYTGSETFGSHRLSEGRFSTRRSDTAKTDIAPFTRDWSQVYKGCLA